MRAHLLLSAGLCFAFIFSVGACKSETDADPVAAAQPPLKAQSPNPSAQEDAPGAGLAPKLTRDIEQDEAERLDLYRTYVNAIVTFAPDEKTGHELLKAMVPAKTPPPEVDVFESPSGVELIKAASAPEPGAAARPWVKTSRDGRIYEPARPRAPQPKRVKSPRYINAGGDRIYDTTNKRYISTP